VKKILFCLGLVGLLVLALGGTAAAQPPTLASLAMTVAGTNAGSFGSVRAAPKDVINPTVSAIVPATAPNDQDTPVTITGTGFATDATGTIQPTASLGDTALTDVTFVDATTLTATVPSGLAPGLYTLTVTNPDSGTASLTDAFTVTPAPTVSAVEPPTAYNDIDEPVTITGANFSTDATGTIPPTASLGTVALTHVTFVDATTLTAKVPWGMDPGSYDLTVVNPDGGTGSLTGAYTVKQGIGQWNSGELFGGQVRQILMKPGDPDTLYAPAYGLVGLFRTEDAAEHWTYVGADVFINNGKFAIDPLHPTWLYAYAYDGLHRSKDEGDTWTTVMPNTWPDGRATGGGRIYPSPHNPQVLFVSSSGESGALGLIKSTDGGASWKIVAVMDGIGVEDVAFHPTDPLQMVLVTSDGRVFHSGNAGSAWSQVLKPPISSGGLIAYNPYKSGEVWVASNAHASGPGGSYKSTDAAFTSWQDVSGCGGLFVTFTGADSVYSTVTHSTDGGLHWEPFGPFDSHGEIRFDPDDSQVGYIGNDTYGVEKTTDGGKTWAVKSQGLSGMRCMSMDVSPADPLRVYATFEHWPGIYRSDDGANNWTYFPVADSAGTPSHNVRLVREDPFDSQRLYVAADTGFYGSTDGGESWDCFPWNVLDPLAFMPWAMEPDPNQPGHLLVGFSNGVVYASGDYGVSWQAATAPQNLGWINDIAFDPQTPELVYLTGAGVYRSTDGGSSWARIDDPQQPEMQGTISLAIATHPQPMVVVEAGSFCAYRSLDGGATWQKARNDGGGSIDYMFADGDSTRLYAAGRGLCFSSDAGDAWEPAAGAFGRLQIFALGYADAGDHTIIYAATNGGQVGAVKSAARATSERADTTASTPVAAGVYRYVVVTSTVTLKLSGLRRGALRLGKRVTARGVVTPTSLAGNKVTLTVQRRHNGHWLRVSSLKRTISAGSTYSGTYKPARTGSYRMRSTVVPTATNTAARTTWHGFKVK